MRRSRWWRSRIETERGRGSTRARLGVGAALVVLAAVGPASAAFAHAVLLRTDPSPQTTLNRPAGAVRLFFSEPVEAAFGAIRVFDVDGRRVDDGRIRRAQGDRQVEVGVRTRDGTYTVTWRVTSTDGHPVHGGFGFYVGAPSTISAAAVPGDQGAGWEVSWGFGAVRVAWFAALSAIVGLVVVRRWVWTPALRQAGLGESVAAAAFKRRFRRALVGTWVVLAAAGALALVFQTATVSGLSLSSSARPSSLSQVLPTAFGRLWDAQMVLTALLALPVVALVRRRPTLGAGPSAWIGVLVAVVGGLCLVTALNGHARTLGRAWLEVPALAVHLGAVAVWVGGLGALMAVAAMGWRLLPADQRRLLAGDLLRRFGRVALVAVVAVVVTGIVNAYGDFSSFSDLWRVGHGRVVAAKVALLAMALVLAARHHWVVRRRLAEPAGAGGGAALASFQRSGAVELALLGGALVLAGALVTMVPGRSLALAERGPVNQERHAGAYTVQLFVDPTALGANQVHVTFVDARGLAAGEVATTDVSLVPPGATPQPVPMRLISPGHFVGDATLATPGPYRLSVTVGAGSRDTTAFGFRLRGSRGP